MAKIFFSITDSSYYTDNRFGRFLENMCVEAKQDCILLFRDHLCGITYRKGNDEKFTYTLRYFKVTDKNEHQDCITVAPDFEITQEVDCYKWLGYRLMESFRALYPELKTADFPVGEFNLWFESDMFNHIFLDD